MNIPTEPIGSIPRPLELLNAIRLYGSSHPCLEPLCDKAVRETIEDRDLTHSARVDYAHLLPSLFELRAGNFYIALVGEPDRIRVLQIIRNYLRPEHRIFTGVVSPIDPRIENPKEVRDRILEAARYIPVEQLGTTDECGFSPFSDDIATTREKAFSKIRSRVEGTALAEDVFNGR